MISTKLIFSYIFDFSLIDVMNRLFDHDKMATGHLGLDISRSNRFAESNDPLTLLF